MKKPPTLDSLCSQLAEQLVARAWLLATAESCTGGMIAATCTDLGGSSAWFERGYVTYSNRAKTELLGVDAQLIKRHGAVSEAVVRAMASGALAQSGAHITVAVTGVAGPSGGSLDKPVGTVWLAWATGDNVICSREWFDGDRAAVRQATVRRAIEGLIALSQQSLI